MSPGFSWRQKKAVNAFSKVVKKFEDRSVKELLEELSHEGYLQSYVDDDDDDDDSPAEYKEMFRTPIWLDTRSLVAEPGMKHVWLVEQNPAVDSLPDISMFCPATEAFR